MSARSGGKYAALALAAWAPLCAAQEDEEVRAQKTPEAESLTMIGLDEAYSFRPGRLHNLRADRFIANHSDVRNPAVAHALLSAVATT